MTLPLNATLLQVAPRYISAEEACMRLGVDENALLVLILAGKVQAAVFGDQVMVAEDSLPAPNGKDRLQVGVETGTIEASMKEMAITLQGDAPVTKPEEGERRSWPVGDDINARLAAIRREDFAHLEGVPITVSEAAEKYGVERHTILAWVRRYTHVVKILERGYRLVLDESGVAYLATIHKARKRFGVKSGSPLVDKSGHPNLIKHPSLSKYRKAKKQQSEL